MIFVLLLYHDTLHYDTHKKTTQYPLLQRKWILNRFFLFQLSSANDTVLNFDLIVFFALLISSRLLYSSGTRSSSMIFTSVCRATPSFSRITSLICSISSM